LITAVTQPGRVGRESTLSAGVWHLLRAWMKKVSGENSRKITLNLNASPYTVYLDNTFSNSANYVNTVGSFLSVGIPLYITLNSQYNVSSLYDDISLVPITLASQFSTLNLGAIGITTQSSITLTDKTQAGLGLFINSNSSPTAGIIVCHDGTTLKTYKFTSETAWSLLAGASGACVYGAGRIVKAVIRRTTGHVYLTAFYNDVQIGAEQDITDAAIVDNTNHGLFSTYNLNSFDNFRADF
jgi:hypothetical protein